jgi:AcrR family transcriptional regulator
MVTRTPGRPRDPSVEGRVVKSTLDVIGEQGLTGLTIDDIAKRAGVSKATIYRRWNSKDELVVDAIATLSGTGSTPSTGDVRRDLTAFVTDLARFFTDSRAGEAFPWLAGEVASQSPIGVRYAAVAMAPERNIVSAIIVEGIERGDLRQDLDVAMAVDIIVGPVLAKRFAGTLADAPETWPETLVGSLLAGWSA